MGHWVGHDKVNRFMTTFLLCALPAIPGCANTAEPEKPENQEISETRPAEPETGQAIAELERRAANVEKGLVPLRQAVEEDPGNADKHMILGQALTQAHFHDEAIAQFQRAAELDSDFRRLLDLGIAYTFAARLDQAAEVYEKVLRLSPDLPVALHNLGNLALRRGDHAKAIDYFNRALAQQPKYLLAQIHLADSLKASGRFREAYGAYEKVLAIEPANPREAGAVVDALYELGSLDLKMGAHVRAKEFLEEVIRLSPEHDRVYYAYGQVMLQLGHPDAAQKAFDKHVQIQAGLESSSNAAMGVGE